MIGCEGFSHDLRQVGTAPILACEQIVGLGESEKASLEGLTCGVVPLSATEGLPRDSLHCREDVFHAMVQFVHQQALQSLGLLVFRDVTGNL